MICGTIACMVEKVIHHDLGIVIVNWNTRDLLRRCLQTVLTSEGDFHYRVVLVDNASTDGSADMVRQEFPTVEVIASPTNGGFSYGNNLGLRHLGYRGAGNVAADAPRYALLLNPDTEVPPNSLYDMVRYMDAHPEIGVAGPKVVLEDGTLDKACRRSFPTPLVAFYHFSGLAKLFPNSPRFARYNMTFVDENQEIEVDSVVGAYMQLRREAIQVVGLLDETFFMYGEDLDWAYRIKQAGWKVFYHPQVTIKHVKRAASRRSKKAQFEFQRAMWLFYQKHYQAKTPAWLDSLVKAALLLKGGRSLWREMRQRPFPMTSP
jgi:N-acetylglucosaminyl-diphospho-decaprenol L-rhamnosyltransferase